MIIYSAKIKKRLIKKEFKEICNMAEVSESNISILGNGSYGIVFKPNDSTEKIKDYVYKFYFEVDGNELDMSKKLIMDIDTFGKYHVPLLDSFDYKRKEFKEIMKKYKLTEVDEITKFFNTEFDIDIEDIDSLEKYYISKYEYGGVNLHKYLKLDVFNTLDEDNQDSYYQSFILDEIKTKNLLNSFKNLFDALFVFHTNNLIHCDIKIDNIVYDDKKIESQHAMRFIDMGLSNIIDIQNPDLRDKIFYNYNISMTDTKLIPYIPQLVKGIVNKDEDELSHLFELVKGVDINIFKDLRKYKKKCVIFVGDYNEENEITDEYIRTHNTELINTISNNIILDILKKNDIYCLLKVIRSIIDILKFDIKEAIEPSINKLYNRFKNNGFYTLPSIDRVSKTFRNILSKHKI